MGGAVITWFSFRAREIGGNFAGGYLEEVTANGREWSPMKNNPRWLLHEAGMDFGSHHLRKFASIRG
jgi:hypothetical protein